MANEFLTPVGRLVQGSVLKGSDKDNKGVPYTVKTGPNKGQPTTKFFMAVAFKKTQAAWWAEPDPMWMMIYNEARTGYPQHFNPQTGACNHPRMAFKIMDGDGADNDGKPNNTKDGFAGHWVLKFSSNFAPRLMHNNQIITDPAYCKTGYFIRVLGTIAPNIGSDVPGVYVNQTGVELLGYGPEIFSGPDVAGAFAAAPVNAAAMPAGFSTMPPTPSASTLAGNGPGAPGGMPQMPGAPGMTAMPGMPPAGAVQTGHMGGMPQMPGGAPQMPGMPALPNQAFVNNVIGQQPAMQQPMMQAPGAMPQMPAPGGMPQMPAMQQQPRYIMTPAAQGYTREQYNAQGYSDDSLIAGGYMVKQ